MPVFLLGRLETPYPMRLANTKDDWKALYLLFGTHQGSFTVTAPVVFPIKISALTQKEKDASGSSALSLWSGDFSCFSWLSKNLTLLPSRWSETVICLLLPPSRTCLSVTPYLLAPFFHYLLQVFCKASAWLIANLLQQLELGNLAQQILLWRYYPGRTRLKGSAIWLMYLKSVVCVSSKWKDQPMS